MDHTSVSLNNLKLTGLVYDEKMIEHKCLWDLKYNEKPERFTCILKRCSELNLVERCKLIKPREAAEEELLKLHSADMITKLKATENVLDQDQLEEISSNFDFLYLHPSTFRLSLLAAGSTIELVDKIMDQEIRNGFALIRPPGHHAMKTEFCGYCYYNNVALAAQHALDNKNINRILIVDWDIHHGQATQQMFYDDPRVLYFSIHGFQNGNFWPHLRESDYHNIGRGAGLGYNVNVPMNKIKMGNSDYLAIWHQLLLPIAYEFDPELVIVSAGYDAALGCPEGEMEVTPQCYAHFIHSLMGLANGRIAVVLEGGYCLKSLAEGAALTVRTLLGDPCPIIEKLAAPSESVKETILSVIYVLRDHWNCLKLNNVFSPKFVNGTVDVEENQFFPKIEFYGLDEKPLKYPTRDICPVQDPIIAAELDRRLDVLIQGANLDVPRYKVAAIVDPDTHILFKRVRVLDRCKTLITCEETVHGGSHPTGSLILELISSIINGECGSGVAVVKNFDWKQFVPALKAAKLALQRSLVIDMVPTPNDERTSLQRPSVFRILLSFFDTSQEPAAHLKISGHHDIDFCFSSENFGNAEILTVWLRLLLPIAYEFNPQIIIIKLKLDGSYGNVSKDCLAQLIHLLSSLAGGRLALVFETSNDPSVNFGDLDVCTRVLLGDTIEKPSCKKPGKLDEVVVEEIRKLIRTHQSSWSGLKFDLELPDINVLIPPWMNDANVLKCNPELKHIFHQ